MKKLIATLLCMVFLVVGSVGCGKAQSVKGKYCDTYGLLNQQTKCEGVQYRTVVGNVIWGIILLETVIAPVYFFGFSLYEPVPGQ